MITWIVLAAYVAVGSVVGGVNYEMQTPTSGTTRNEGVSLGVALVWPIAVLSWLGIRVTRRRVLRARAEAKMLKESGLDDE